MHKLNDDIEKFERLAHAKTSVKKACFLPEIAVKHWSMDQGKVIHYQKNDYHTLSLYLNGGQKNYRLDKNKLTGAPGKICLMPQGQESQWQIQEKVEFVHLYFSDSVLKRYAAAHFGIDVRFIELNDLLFLEDQELKKLLKKNHFLFNNMQQLCPLFSEELIYQIMDYLLKKYNGFKLKEQKITGGLSPKHCQQIRSIIADSIHKKITIENLSQHIHISPYHFARMFKLSFGQSPAHFITRYRVHRVKNLLKKNIALSEISLLTGFNHQSHMTQYFKKLVGVTPAHFKKLIKK